MNIIHNYSENAFYTFETAIIGKEYFRLVKNYSQILIPCFQVELNIGSETKCFNKEYLLFNNVSYFNARYSYYDSVNIDEYDLIFPFLKNNFTSKIELESLAYRENMKSFCTYTIAFERLDVFYDEQVNYYQDVFINSMEEIIKKNNLYNFLTLKEIDIDNSTNLHNLLINA